jgi:hypothetical protein
MDLIRFQCVTHDSVIGQSSLRDNATWRGNNWAFELSYYLFNAGVTLMSGFAKMPVEARAQEVQQLVRRSIEILEDASRQTTQVPHCGQTKREVALQASEVPNMLGRELGWRDEEAGKSALGIFDPLTEQHGPTAHDSSLTGHSMDSFGVTLPSPYAPSMDSDNETPLPMLLPMQEGSPSQFSRETS